MDATARSGRRPERAGTPIGANGLLIAAHTLAHGLILVTANEDAFRRVSGLVVENWLSHGGGEISV
jgi:tRNA(fMet)-specific endonuclease VapC